MSKKSSKKEKDAPFYVYSKEVKGDEITGDEVVREIDKKKLLTVIRSLLGIGKTKRLEELELKDNCKEWVRSLLSDYPSVNKEHIKFLTRDFTDSMYTRMREEEKYVVAIIMDRSLILCHSIYGESTITPNWEVIERMLDKDNVIRYVYFELEDSNVNVTFFEHTKSIFFIEWLGLPEKEAFSYLGGKNRFYTEVYDSNLVFEFTDENFEKKVIEDGVLKIEGNQIVLPEPIQRLHISQIRAGKKPYKNTEDFKQDFLAKRYELSYYQEEYKNLQNSLRPLTTKFIDEEYEVRDSKNNMYLKKRNPNFTILFCNEFIDLRKSFLGKIKTKIVNKEHLRLFHAGMSLNPSPVKIGNIEIYNVLDTNLSRHLIDYYNEINTKNDFNLIFLFTIFDILQKSNQDTPICYFLRAMNKQLVEDINFDYSFVGKEDEVLELKSRDFVAGKNNDIVDNLRKDADKKIKKSNFKIYFIGADEKTKKFEAIPIERFDDDRLQSIEKKLNKENKCKFHLIKVPSKDGKEGIIICCVKKL